MLRDLLAATFAPCAPLVENLQPRGSRGLMKDSYAVVAAEPLNHQQPNTELFPVLWIGSFSLEVRQ